MDVKVAFGEETIDYEVEFSHPSLTSSFVANTSYDKLESIKSLLKNGGFKDVAELFPKARKFGLWSKDVAKLKSEINQVKLC